MSFFIDIIVLEWVFILIYELKIININTQSNLYNKLVNTICLVYGKYDIYYLLAQIYNIYIDISTFTDYSYMTQHKHLTIAPFGVGYS